MDGGDLLFEDCKYGESKPGSRLIFPHGGSTRSNASIVSVLVCFLVGCAALRLFDFTSAGVINVVVVGVAMLLLSQLSFSLFIRTWRYSRENDYTDLFKDAFNVNPIAISLLIILSAISLTVYFTGKIISVWKSLFKPFVSKGNIVMSDYLVGYILCGIFPIIACSIGSFISFVPLSYVANFCTLLAAVPLFIDFGKSLKIQGFDPTHQVKIATSDFWQTVDIITTFSMLFFVHPFIKFVAKFSVHKTQQSIENITWAANTINLVYNTVCIIIGYFNYMNKYPGKFYFDTMDPTSALAILAKVCTIINLTITNAGYYKLFTDQIAQMFHTTDTVLIVSIISNATVAVLSVGASIIGGIAATIIDLIGSMSFVIVTFIIPAIIYLRMYKLSSFLGYTAIFLLVVGLVILVLISYRSISNTFFSN